MSALTGYLGADLQRDHTAVMLREPPSPATAVGDGCRTLIPNAVRPDLNEWGSAAAGAPADPLSVDFLLGLRRRLYGYLGQLAPLTRNGYRVFAVSPPDRPATMLPSRFAEAGLPDVEQVDPADALLAHWLVTSGAQPAPVIAVVCGEGWTVAAAYRAEGGRLRRVPGAARISGPATGLTAAVVAEVCGRCRETPPAGEAFAAAQSVLEFAARLRSTDEPVTWNGPLTDRMFEPFTRSRADVATAPGVIAAAARLRRLADLVGDGQPAGTVVVGGTGSIWPVVARTLSAYGPVWQSRTPELDLATGATWWPAARSLVADGSARSYTVLDEPETAAPAPPPAGEPFVHPWLRRSA